MSKLRNLKHRLMYCRYLQLKALQREFSHFRDLSRFYYIFLQITFLITKIYRAIFYHEVNKISRSLRKMFLSAFLPVWSPNSFYKGSNFTLMSKVILKNLNNWTCDLKMVLCHVLAILALKLDHLIPVVARGRHLSHDIARLTFKPWQGLNVLPWYTFWHLPQATLTLTRQKQTGSRKTFDWDSVNTHWELIPGLQWAVNR